MYIANVVLIGTLGYREMCFMCYKLGHLIRGEPHIYVGKVKAIGTIETLTVIELGDRNV